jgi:predicted nucleic acid-binding protein
MYLLDINILLAFSYDEQVAHGRVLRWIRHVQETESARPLFATCAIVDLGFIRIASGPARLAENLTFARADLRRLKRVLDLQMLGDELDGNQLPDWVTKSQQTTDGHLLKLATSHHARFATLDTGIPGAILIPEHLDPPLEVREMPPPYYGVLSEFASEGRNPVRAARAAGR